MRDVVADVSFEPAIIVCVAILLWFVSSSCWLSADLPDCGFCCRSVLRYGQMPAHKSTSPTDTSRSSLLLCVIWLVFIVFCYELRNLRSNGCYVIFFVLFVWLFASWCMTILSMVQDTQCQYTTVTSLTVTNEGLTSINPNIALFTKCVSIVLVCAAVAPFAHS